MEGHCWDKAWHGWYKAVHGLEEKVQEWDSRCVEQINKRCINKIGQEDALLRIGGAWKRNRQDKS